MAADPRRLLRRYADSIDRLRQLGVVRSGNNPVADYAEWLVARAMGLTLAPKSTTGYDAVDRAGTRFEIKARRITAENGSRQLSAIRSLDAGHFDRLVGVLFSGGFEVLRAASMPIEVVRERSAYRSHTNAYVLHLRDAVWDDPRVVDLTERLRRAQDESDDRA